MHRGRARLAIVIDDVGESTRAIQPFLQIPWPLAFSILPATPEARRCLAEIRARGRVAMLHLPMEPVSKQSLEPHTITCNLPDSEVHNIVEADLAAVPGVVGINNHMGSKATQDPRIMRDVLSVAAEHRVFFLDSKTWDHTAVAAAAQEEDVPHLARDGRFLDDRGDTSGAEEVLLELGRIALEQGHAIGIGHPHPGTAAAIRAAIPRLEAMGVTLVPITALLR